LGGEEFERRLGRFLLQSRAFGEIKDLIGPSAKMGGVPQQVNEHNLADWHTQTSHQLTEINHAINECLFEQFAEVYAHAAGTAYAELLTELRVGSGDSLVIATTNYDSLCEAALLDMDLLPDWGEVAQMP